MTSERVTLRIAFGGVFVFWTRTRMGEFAAVTEKGEVGTVVTLKVGRVVSTWTLTEVEAPADCAREPRAGAPSFGMVAVEAQFVPVEDRADDVAIDEHFDRLARVAGALVGLAGEVDADDGVERDVLDRHEDGGCVGWGGGPWIVIGRPAVAACSVALSV
jgi:hypothetical protein